MAVKYPDRVAFTDEEIGWIEYGRLVLLGVQPSEIPHLTDEEIAIIFQIAAGQAAAEQGKIAGYTDL